MGQRRAGVERNRRAERIWCGVWPYGVCAAAVGLDGRGSVGDVLVVTKGARGMLKFFARCRERALS